jgi:hypothetical protein
MSYKELIALEKKIFDYLETIKDEYNILRNNSNHGYCIEIIYKQNLYAFHYNEVFDCNLFAENLMNDFFNKYYKNNFPTKMYTNNYLYKIFIKALYNFNNILFKNT